jgi:hypothetical protein
LRPGKWYRGDEKGKMKKEKGEKPRVAGWRHVREEIKNYELRITNYELSAVACFPLTLYQPATDTVQQVNF